MIKSITATCFLAFCLTSAHAQFFDSLSAPRVWLRADNCLACKEKWIDVSGNQNHATFNGVSFPPDSGLLNYNRAFFLDGDDDHFSVPVSLEKASAITIISVFHSSDTTEQWVVGAANATARKVKLTTRRADGPNNTTYFYGKNEQRTVIQTTAQSWGLKGKRSSNAYMKIAKYAGDKTFKGRLAEVLVFDRALGFLERVQIETYLAIKYGANVPGRNYVSSTRQLVWDAGKNSDYSQGIAGIGRDDNFGLYQRQSASAYDSGFFVMSASALAKRNEENKAVINNSDFIVWGDNGKNITAVETQGRDTTLSILKHQWKVAVAGATASGIPTELYLQQQKLPENKSDFWLVIDRTGQGNFSPDHLEYIMPSACSDGIVCYKNVRWDTDGSGHDAFALAKGSELFAIVRTTEGPTCTDKKGGKAQVEIIKGEAPFSYSLKVPGEEGIRQWSNASFTTAVSGLPTGDYTLRVKDGTGREIERNLFIPTAENIMVDLGADKVLDPGVEILLNAGRHVPDSVPVRYYWESNFGVNSTTPQLRVTESGIYTVTVIREADGCEFTDEINISGATSQRLTVYPTVVSSGQEINVGISLPEAGPVSVSITNTSGVSYFKVTGENKSEYAFVVKPGAAGLNVIVIQTNTGIQTRKIIITN